MRVAVAKPAILTDSGGLVDIPFEMLEWGMFEGWDTGAL